MVSTSGRKALPVLALMFLSATAVGCKQSDATLPGSDHVVEETPSSMVIEEDGLVRPSVKALKAFEVSTVGDAEDMEHMMAPAVVALKDTAVSAVVSPVEGRVETLHVVEGQRVLEGERVATIRSPELINLKAELRSAQARLELARDIMARQEQLSEDGVALAAEVSAARSALSEAESDVARLRSVLRSVGSSNTETLSLYSQRDGVVLSRQAVIGDSVGPNEDALMIIGDTQDLWLIAHVFEGDLERIVPDSSVRVHLPGGVGESSGRIARVGEVVETSLRRAPVWIELENAEGLRPGMIGQAGLQLRTDSSLRLPPTAVLLDEHGVYRVWIEAEEGAYRPREVVVGQTRHGLVEVMSGLNPGERVVTKGALLLDASASMRL